jgi:excisionase family DNA binding protein
MTDLPELDQTCAATVHDIRSLVYTVPEIALLLMIPRQTAYAMVRTGQIPARQLGSRWVIPREVFHAWLNSTPVPA